MLQQVNIHGSRERGISVGSRTVHEGPKSKPELILKSLGAWPVYHDLLGWTIGHRGRMGRIKGEGKEEGEERERGQSTRGVVE